MKKLTILTISALAIMAAASAAFSAEAKTEPTSQDVQMKNGSWTELAQLYPVVGRLRRPDDDRPHHARP